MRFYYNKKDKTLFIVGKDTSDLPHVVFVEDRGVKYGNPNKPRTNIFGYPIVRYRYHWSNIEEGYSTCSYEIKSMLGSAEPVSLTRTVRRKIKIKP